jgi:aryl-alcohol dehydrogenase-like predicted oxidoreductase
MKKVKFGRTGLEVSVVGFGGAPIGILEVEQEKAARVLNLLLDSGVNLIDTAAGYAGSEEMIGKAISHRRAEFVLVSKCGRKVPGIDAPEWSAENVWTTIEQSLRKLRTDYLDAMLLHSCDLETLKRGEAVAALAEAQKAGKVRWPGYSGDNEAAAWAAGRAELAVLETSVNITDQANIDLVLPVARKNNVGVLAKRPIANAAWKPIGEQPGFYASYASTYTDRFAQMKMDSRELRFGGKAEEAWPEVALRFTLSQPGVHCAIIGTTNPENAKRNIEYAGKGALPEEVVGRIRAAFRRAEGASGSKWVGQI